MADDGALRDLAQRWRLNAETMRASNPDESVLRRCAGELTRALDSTVPASDGGATNPEVVEGLRLLDALDDAYEAHPAIIPDHAVINARADLIDWCRDHLHPILAAAAGEQVEP